MSNTRITARITDQQLELINVPVIASGSEAMLQIVCEFCELWKGYAKTAVFYKDKRQVFHVPLQTLGNQTQCLATVPHEVLAEEGHFYFGVLGILENTRTTEVIHLQVRQGAICASTAEPQDPTPDIYQQLLAAYGDINNRFSEMIAMRGLNGATEHTLSDEYINGKIITNGASAYIDFNITKMSLMAGGFHYTDYCIPPGLAPFYMVLLTTSNSDINVTIDNLKSQGWCRLLIENVGNQMLTTDDVVSVFGSYPLTSVFIAELADLRVGADGKTYPTAGDAVRAQLRPGGSSRVLLWDNPSSAMSFGAGSLLLDLSGYDGIEVLFHEYDDSTDNTIISSGYIPLDFQYKSDGSALPLYGQGTLARGIVTYYRCFYVHPTGIDFEVANVFDDGNPSLVPAYVIPYRIYGIKNGA